MVQRKPVPRSIMMQSLKGISILSARTWRQLDTAESEEDQTRILTELLELQESQESAIDTFAELADQLDAEITAIKARKQHLVETHDREIERLSNLRDRLDQTVLDMNESGLLSSDSPGQTRRIKVKENPPSCAIVDESQIPEEYLAKKEKVEYKPDKTKIIKAWTKGTPVPGTYVYRKRRVEYNLAPTIGQLKDDIQQSLLT